MTCSMAEKRKYLRLEYVIPVEISLEDSGTQVHTQGFCRNIGHGGIGVELNLSTLSNKNIIKEGKITALSIELPKKLKPVKLLGQIRWETVNADQHKVFFGIEFTAENNPSQISNLYDFAKSDLKRRRITKRWFTLSIAAVISLAVWGINLTMDNYYLSTQLQQFTSLRNEMERSIMLLRDDKFAVEKKLLSLNKETGGLTKELELLRTRTTNLNSLINGLNKKITANKNLKINKDQEAGIEELKKMLGEKTALNNQLQTHIDYIEKKLVENEKLVNQIYNKYTEISNAFYNRISTKKLLDKEIKNLSAKTRMENINISASGYTSLPRGMWVMNKELFKFSSKSDEIIEFCKRKNINLIFARIDLENEIALSQLPAFLKKAHENKISVHAYFCLNGHKAAEKNKKACVSFVANVVKFNKKQTEISGFDGVNIAFVNEIFSSYHLDDISFYLDAIDKLVRGRNEKQFPLKIGVSLPDSTKTQSTKISRNDKLAEFIYHLIDIVDYLSIENLGQSGNYDKEIAYASEKGKKIYIGKQLNINEDSYNAKLSGKYIHDMETDISALIEKYLDEPGFMGIAIGNYNNYRQCIEDNTPEFARKNTMVISVRPPKIDYRGSKMQLR
ncbi:PilZ domain-containing protein [bacterium]|nr:PilZ domain-containing protein [bacterium]